MKLAIIGKSGQLAQSLLRLSAASGVPAMAMGRAEIDLLNADHIEQALRYAKVTCVINAAAYTHVDRAELEPCQAYAINATGAGIVAAVSAKLDLPIIHISTDHVFSGQKRAPYSEADGTGPVNAYGDSKLKGEQNVARMNPRHIVVRTAWLYGPDGNNFVAAILNRAKRDGRVEVVDDQYGNPTFVDDLAAGLLQLSQMTDQGSESLWGIYHLTGQGSASRFEFARHILACAQRRGYCDGEIVPVRTARSSLAAPYRRDLRLVELTQQQGFSERYAGGARFIDDRSSNPNVTVIAQRPADGRLDTAKVAGVLGREMPAWRASAEKAVWEIVLRETSLTADIG